MFIYYTNLSNLLVAAYYFLLTVCGDTGALGCAVPRFALVTAISLTMFIFAFVLTPEYRRRRKQGEAIGQDRADSYILHYAVPVLCIAEWFLFAPKQPLQLWHGLLALLVPMCYCIFIFLRACLYGNIPGRSTAYPYSFMDAKKYGLPVFLRNIAVISVLLVAVGILYIFLGQFLHNGSFC